MHFSLKSVRAIPEKRNDEHTILVRKAYAESFTLIEEQFPWRNIIFLDEVGFNVSMRIKKGRSLVGTTPVSNIKNVSHHPYNKNTFKDYIGNLTNYLENNSLGPCVFIMDNVAFHKCDKARISTPYSPFLNPIENMFSKWKNVVKRSNCMNEEQILMSMNSGVREITEADCDGWYRNMKKFYGDPKYNKRGYWDPLTSLIDWCEENYIDRNTISNIAYLVVFVAALKKRRSKDFYNYFYSYTILSIIHSHLVMAIGSGLFHATLKYRAQLLDEFPMILLVNFLFFDA
ncbi:hypothetical protein RF11_10436 [Thelohanellus kitauei]|uniref:Alkaline ceramidase n=1 Tax=Thelohanellus kitauei TaxID=669202 RepID=A0A0C2JZQ9_THEKT|nr:hypothetical protein RF11_10436 [Thelohanellus kitauei]